MHKLSPLAFLAFMGLSLSVNAGEFGNRCTTGLTKGVIVNADCTINETFKGNTLCFGNAEAKQVFLDSKDKQQFVDKAAAFYPKVLNGSVK